MPHRKETALMRLYHKWLIMRGPVRARLADDIALSAVLVLVLLTGLCA